MAVDRFVGDIKIKFIFSSSILHLLDGSSVPYITGLASHICFVSSHLLIFLRTLPFIPLSARDGSLHINL